KILLETNQLLQVATNKQEIIDITCKQLLKLFNRDIVYYQVNNGTLDEPYIYVNDDSNNDKYLAVNEQAVAKWVLKNNKHAGAGTNTLNSVSGHYLAVRANENIFGVVGIFLNDNYLKTFEENIMLSVLGECGLALENYQSRKEKERINIKIKNEQLRSNLLQSISHDLRTPLTSILGNISILMDNNDKFSLEKINDIYEDIYLDASWLINLVENILSITKIESDNILKNKTIELVDDVVEEALKHIDRRKVLYDIEYLAKKEYILASMDAHLIMQVIINIINNAIKYTPPNTHILVQADAIDDNLVIAISDNGDGIKDEDKVHIFEMFYIANGQKGDSSRSMGLGLALCKSIINAHQGTIEVCDNYPKGTIFTFRIPLMKEDTHGK
ncbi:MAG: ATP-binding protein, partial [Erysipelotrichaceae bacterium]